MKDELKKRRKPEEGVRGRQEGVGQVWKRKPECVGKQERCQYMIALLRFCGIQDQRCGGPMRNWDSRFETSDRGPRATWDFRWGGPTQANPTGLSSGG